MIARIWTARVVTAMAPVYSTHLETRVLPALTRVEGFKGIKFLQRETEDSVEIIVMTFWESLDSIHNFAGADITKAVVDDEILPVFIEYDRIVRHYTVSLTHNTLPQ